MSQKKGILGTMLMVFSLLTLQAQENLSWLDDFTASIQVANDSYQYAFSNVDGNECKLKVEEQHTNKKGSISRRSWIFYLSDLDPSALSFKAKGKSINLVMETRRSQKFISYYEMGELEGYTEKVTLTMNEVEMARSFIDLIKERISDCQVSQQVWDQPRQAFNWLVDNVGNANDEGTEWEQEFAFGSREYMVDFQANSVNSKGESNSTGYTFNLNDINPAAIDLKISGKSLMVELAVKENKRYIEEKTPEGSFFTNKLLIYASEIEQARELVNALFYLVSNTTPDGLIWDSYASSLEFIQENLGELSIGEVMYAYEFQFEPSPSGLVQLATKKSKPDGSSESLVYAFYLADIMDQLEISVSKNSISLELDTKEKQEYIRVLQEGKTNDYTSSISFYGTDLDLARDVVNAFEHAIGFSEEQVLEFTNIAEIESWFSENIGTVEVGEQTIAQSLSILKDFENQITVNQTISESDGASIESQYILYPEDVSMEKLNIKVSGKKLYVLLQTDKGKYVKHLENGQVQNFVSTAEILFYDPLDAKNFMAAIGYLHNHSVPEEKMSMNKEEALAFLLEHIQQIELPDKSYEQKLEPGDEDNCHVSFTRVEKDSKGGSQEYRYEFALSDIHSGNSNFTIKGASVIVNLLTQGGEKLIKPYKNGEAGNFVDDFFLYTDDVLKAKRLLGAFSDLSEACK